jgi:hypothetical protein
MERFKCAENGCCISSSGLSSPCYEIRNHLSSHKAGFMLYALCSMSPLDFLTLAEVHNPTRQQYTWEKQKSNSQLYY